MYRTIFIALLAVGSAVAAGDDDDTAFSLTPTKDKDRECRGEDGSRGICVHHSYCNGTKHYLPYGIIDDNEERIGRECPGSLEWCCVPPAEYIDAPATPQRAEDDAECAAAVGQSCSWCVDLHKVGGNPLTMSASGKFCAGTLLAGGRAVLTSASCVSASRERALTVRTADGRERRVASSTVHPRYNSGTKERDVAVLALSGETLGGGCGLRASDAGGECVARARGGTVAAVRVSDGRCAGGSAVAGAVCVGGGGSCGGSGEGVVCGGKVSAVQWGSCGGTSLRGEAGEWARGFVARRPSQENAES